MFQESMLKNGPISLSLLGKHVADFKSNCSVLV